MSKMEEGQKWGVAGKPGEERSTRGEQQQQSLKQPLWRNWRDLSGLTICIAVSVLCLGVCIVVFVRTSELQSRIVSMEQKQRDAQLSAWVLSLEQVEPVILGRLDQILEEKLAARLPKTREVREAPHSCLCPPGPPKEDMDLLFFFTERITTELHSLPTKSQLLLLSAAAQRNSLVVDSADSAGPSYISIGA